MTLLMIGKNIRSRVEMDPFSGWGASMYEQSQIIAASIGVYYYFPLDFVQLRSKIEQISLLYKVN
jgi:hypothetical protein